MRHSLRLTAALAIALTCCTATRAEVPLEQIRGIVGRELPAVIELYKHLHAHPELSFHEQQTAATLAEHMRKLGYEVTTNVGGHGVVALLRNGRGPTVLIRTDTDALPVTEATALDYASKVRVKNAEGQEVGVMHACGHDVHMANWYGVAKVLSELKDQWRGTAVFIAQPAEERGAGARAMLEDGLFERFPKPDFALAMHVDSYLPHGTVGFTPGWAMANVDSMDITIRGKGGHGAAPHATVDPVVIAARLILDLQTLVSRENDPIEPAVVTVGSIHGGTKHNIIGNEVHLQLTVRSYKDEVRKLLLEGIERKAKAAAMSAAAPEPIIKVDPSEYTPALFNHPDLTQRVVNTIRDTIGAAQVIERPPVMGGEDFGRYGRAGVPIVMLRLGSVEPAAMAEAQRTASVLPSLHSAAYAPVPEPTLRTGMTTLSAAAMELLQKR